MIKKYEIGTEYDPTEEFWENYAYIINTFYQQHLNDADELPVLTNQMEIIEKDLYFEYRLMLKSKLGKENDCIFDIPYYRVLTTSKKIDKKRPLSVYQKNLRLNSDFMKAIRHVFATNHVDHIKFKDVDDFSYLIATQEI